MSPEDSAIIATNLCSLEEKSSEQAKALSLKFGKFMDQIATGVNHLDSFLGFHLDLFAHCDGEVSELMREKAAALFNPLYRAAAKGSGKPAAGEGVPSGLLGGETEVRSRLVEATKEDELLAKTMNKPHKKKPSSHGGGGGAKRSRRDRSRSRSRRRSYSRSRRDRSRSPRGGRQDTGSGLGKQLGQGRGSKSS